MLITNVDVLLIIVYFVIVLVIGFIASKKEINEDFLLANRKLNTFQFMTTVVASFIGGGSLIAFASYVYLYGISAIWFYLAVIIACFLFVPYAIKIKKLSKKNNFYTMSDYFNFKFGGNVAGLTTVVLFFVYFMYLAGQFIAGSFILSSLTGLTYSLSLVLCGTVIFIYLWAGGFKAVTKTDTFQYFIMLFLLGALGMSLMKGIEFTPQQLHPFAIGPALLIGFILYGLLSVVCGADMWQRIYAARDERVVRHGLIIAGIFLLLIGFAIAFVALSARFHFPAINPEEAVLYGFQNLLPPVLYGFGIVVLFAVIMSTADTLIFLLSLSLSKDVVMRTRKTGSLKNMTKYAIFFVTAIGMLIAYLFKDIIKVYSALANLLFTLAPTIIGSFYVELKKKAILLSLVAGLVTLVIILILQQLRPETVLLSFVASLIFLIIGQYMFKKQ